MFQRFPDSTMQDPHVAQVSLGGGAAAVAVQQFKSLSDRSYSDGDLVRSGHSGAERLDETVTSDVTSTVPATSMCSPHPRLVSPGSVSYGSSHKEMAHCSSSYNGGTENSAYFASQGLSSPKAPKVGPDLYTKESGEDERYVDHSGSGSRLSSTPQNRGYQVAPIDEHARTHLAIESQLRTTELGDDRVGDRRPSLLEHQSQNNISELRASLDVNHTQNTGAQFKSVVEPSDSISYNSLKTSTVHSNSVDFKINDTGLNEPESSSHTERSYALDSGQKYGSSHDRSVVAVMDDNFNGVQSEAPVNIKSWQRMSPTLRLREEMTFSDAKNDVVYARHLESPAEDLQAHSVRFNHDSHSRSNIAAQRMVQESLRAYFPTVGQPSLEIYRSNNSDSNHVSSIIEYGSSRSTAHDDHESGFHSDYREKKTGFSLNETSNPDIPPTRSMSVTSDASQCVPENLCLSETQNLRPLGNSGRLNHLPSSLESVMHQRDAHQTSPIFSQSLLPPIQQIPEPPMTPLSSRVPDSPLPHPNESPMPLLRSAPLESMSIMTNSPTESPMSVVDCYQPHFSSSVLNQVSEPSLTMHYSSAQTVERSSRGHSSTTPHRSVQFVCPKTPSASHHRPDVKVSFPSQFHTNNFSSPDSSMVPCASLRSSDASFGTSQPQFVDHASGELFSTQSRIADHAQHADRPPSATQTFIESPHPHNSYMLQRPPINHHFKDLDPQEGLREVEPLMAPSRVNLGGTVNETHFSGSASPRDGHSNMDVNSGLVYARMPEANLQTSTRSPAPHARQDYPLPSMSTHYDVTPDSTCSPATFHDSTFKYNQDSIKYSPESVKYSPETTAKFVFSNMDMKCSSRYLDPCNAVDLQHQAIVGSQNTAPLVASQAPPPPSPMHLDPCHYYSTAPYSPHGPLPAQQLMPFNSQPEHCIDRDGMLVDKFDRMYQDVKPFDQEYPMSVRPTLSPESGVSRPPRLKKPKEPKPPRVPVVHKCKECERVFKNSTQLKNHMWRHTGEKPFTCDECGSKFTQQGNLRAHRRIHTGERPYECPICKHCFTQLSTLKTHQKIHSDERPHKCTLCEAAFRQVANLKTHQVTHTGERPHKCEMCDKAFTQKSNLKAHKNRVHNPDGSFTASSRRGRKKNLTAVKPFSCVECAAKFTMMSNLKIHMKLHAGARNHVCEVCGAAFSQRTNLKAHVQRMHNSTQKKLKCDECPSSFRLKRCLKAHKRKRHPIKSLKIKILGESKYYMRERSASDMIDGEEPEEGEDRSYIAEPIVQLKEPKQEPADAPESPSHHRQMDYFASVPGEEEDQSYPKGGPTNIKQEEKSNLPAINSEQETYLLQGDAQSKARALPAFNDSSVDPQSSAVSVDKGSINVEGTKQIISPPSLDGIAMGSSDISPAADLRCVTQSKVSSAITLVENIVSHLDSNKNSSNMSSSSNSGSIVNKSVESCMDPSLCQSEVYGGKKDISFVPSSGDPIEKVTQQLTVHLERLAEEFKQDRSKDEPSQQPASAGARETHHLTEQNDTNVRSNLVIAERQSTSPVSRNADQAFGFGNSASVERAAFCSRFSESVQTNEEDSLRDAPSSFAYERRRDDGDDMNEDGELEQGGESSGTKEGAVQSPEMMDEQSTNKTVYASSSVDSYHANRPESNFLPVQSKKHT